MPSIKERARKFNTTNFEGMFCPTNVSVCGCACCPAGGNVFADGVPPITGGIDAVGEGAAIQTGRQTAIREQDEGIGASSGTAAVVIQPCRNAQRSSGWLAGAALRGCR